jgi:lysophospholipase L1-like esterase
MAPASRLLPAGAAVIGLALVGCRAAPADAAAPASAATPVAAVEPAGLASTGVAPSTAPGLGPPPRTADPEVLTANAPVPRRTYVVAAIGDSLTDFRSHGGGYLKRLQERCPESRFDSYGKGGDMVNQMRKRLGKDVFAAPAAAYTHLIVFGGVNDLYSDLTAGRTVAKIAKDLLAMYDAAHEHGLKVVALTVAPWGGFSRYFTEARGATTLELDHFILAQQKSGKADFVVDTYPLLSCGAPEKLCDALAAPFHDGLHFGPAGHEKIADALFTSVFSDCR